MRTNALRVMALLALAAAAPPARAADSIACSGLFGRSTSHAELVKAFGAENVVYKKIDAPQGSTGMATVLFEKNPERRLMIEWFDEKNLSRPIYIGINGHSKWLLPHALKIGSLIDEVERQNGKPFRLNGFGWDLGGHARFGKSDGNLGNVEGGCHFGLAFEPTAEGLPLGGKYRTLNGNHDLYSDMPLLREVKPAIVEIFLIYAENH